MCTTVRTCSSSVMADLEPAVVHVYNQLLYMYTCMLTSIMVICTEMAGTIGWLSMCVCVYSYPQVKVRKSFPLTSILKVEFVEDSPATFRLVFKNFLMDLEASNIIEASEWVQAIQRCKLRSNPLQALLENCICNTCTCTCLCRCV